MNFPTQQPAFKRNISLTRIWRLTHAFWVLLVPVAPARGAELPQFIVPGLEGEMKALNELHALHAKTAFSDCPLWDVWLPHATLWTGQTSAYRASFLKRRIDTEGYVSMQQHRGMAHSEGWPFPAGSRAAGRGSFSQRMMRCMGCNTSR